MAHRVPIPLSGVWCRLVESLGLSQDRLQFPKSIFSEICTTTFYYKTTPGIGGPANTCVGSPIRIYYFRNVNYKYSKMAAKRANIHISKLCNVFKLQGAFGLNSLNCRRNKRTKKIYIYYDFYKIYLNGWSEFNIFIFL